MKSLKFDNYKQHISFAIFKAAVFIYIIIQKRCPPKAERLDKACKTGKGKKQI